MKRPLPFFFLVSFFFVHITSTNLFGQQVFKTTNGSVIGYLEYLPPDYHSNSNKYPVVIFLHGLGEKGPNSTDPAVLEQGATLLAKHGPPKHAKNGYQFPFILISPQLKTDVGNWPTAYVMEVINYVKTYLRIDERRIHITGLSLGGGGAWTMAQTYPAMFASLSPVCGGYNSTSKACFIASENLPVWAFHGDSDTTVPLSRSVNMVNAINACTPAPSPLAKMSIYPGVKHNAWDRAYDPTHTYHNPNVYDWIMSYTNTINGTNKIPVANAGSDKIITGTTYTLTGSASDADGSIASYAWTKMSGPACTMANTTSRSLSLSNLNVGVYMFRFTAKDNGGQLDTDYVKVTVQIAPVANAGSDVTITLPANSAVLNGSGTDADGTISSYKWTYISGPATPTLTNATTKSVTVSALNTAGEYVMELEVKDNKGGIGKDQVKINVKSSTEKVTNVAPVAKAGSDISITLPTSSASLSGSGSDSDGTITAYKWTFVSGPATPTLANVLTTKVSVSGMTVAGVYSFQLEVTDNGGATGKDQVNVTVNPALAANTPPVAYAGKDKFIYLPESSATITGTGTDADGTIVSYSWVQVSGPLKATLTGATTPTLTASGMKMEGFYVFKLIVKDNSGAFAEDKVGVSVKSLSAASSAFQRNVQLVEPIAEEEVVDLSDDANPYWKDKQVIVFSETGARLYNGSWQEESYASVFDRTGMFIYTVMSGSRRLLSGKIVITP